MENFMWEICLTVKNQNCCDFIFSSIKKQLDGICLATKNFENQNYQICIACEEYDKSRSKVFLTQIIADCICIFYKGEFLDSKLMLPVKNGIYVKALKKALLNFDKETDIYIISKALDLENSLNLDGFYYFNLRSLREKWEELSSIANDNGYFLISPENFVDLLKFLVDNLEITHDTVNVYCDEGGFKISDELDKDIAVNKDEDLLSTLIGLSPKRINFYGDINTEKYLLISQVFQTRINCM